MSPAPVNTMQAIEGSSRVDFTASIISSSVCSRNAFITRGRLMVIQATWSFTSIENVAVVPARRACVRSLPAPCSFGRVASPLATVTPLATSPSLGLFARNSLLADLEVDVLDELRGAARADRGRRPRTPAAGCSAGSMPWARNAAIDLRMLCTPRDRIAQLGDDGRRACRPAPSGRTSRPPCIAACRPRAMVGTLRQRRRACVAAHRQRPRPIRRRRTAPCRRSG